MQRHFFSQAVLVVGILILGSVSCADATGPTRESVAGTYALESSVGDLAPVTGTFILTADARAERRVSYANDSAERVASGTFDVSRNGNITFALDLPCPPAAVCLGGEWTMTARRAGDGFIIEYPGAADAPNRETYVRLGHGVLR